MIAQAIQSWTFLYAMSPVLFVIGLTLLYAKLVPMGECDE